MFVRRPCSYSLAKPCIASLVYSIREFAKDGQLSRAVIAYAALRLLSPPPRDFLHPISSLLASSGKLRAFLPGLQLHAHLLSLGFHGNSFLRSRLVAFYAAFGHLDEARVLAEGSSSRESFPWNILLSAYISSGFPWRALLVHLRMVNKEIAVDGFACSSILKACGAALNFFHARMLHAVMQKTGVLSQDLFLYNALISVYAKCGSIADAEKMFDEMPRRDIVSWNAMISGYVSLGMWENSRKLLEIMRSEVTVNTVTWNAVICGNLQVGNFVGALQLVSQMRKVGSPLDAVTIIVSLSTCSKLRCLKLGEEIHALALRFSFDLQERVTNSLITMYSRCDQIQLAEILFRNCKNRSSVTWSCIIAGYTLVEKHAEATSLFREMLQQVHQPTQAAILAVLPLYGRLGDHRRGKELHCYITKMTSCSSLPIWNALIFMYCRSGNISEAWKVFLSMGEKDRFSYTSMICGFGREGEGLRALTLFKAMTRQGLTPDNVAISAVLSACCQAGLLTEAQWIFENITRLCGIVPRPEHYSYMVNRYVRAGYLGHAEEFLYWSMAQPAAATSTSAIYRKPLSSAL